MIGIVNDGVSEQLAAGVDGLMMAGPSGANRDDDLEPGVDIGNEDNEIVDFN